MFHKIPASKKSLANRKLIFGIGINDSDYITDTVINGKRVLVDPRQYIEGITKNIELSTPTTQHFWLDDQETIVHDEKDMKYITQLYPTVGDRRPNSATSQIQTEFDWKDWKSWGNNQPETVKNTCEECVFKEAKVESMLEDIEFVDEQDSWIKFDSLK